MSPRRLLAIVYIDIVFRGREALRVHQQGQQKNGEGCMAYLGEQFEDLRIVKRNLALPSFSLRVIHSAWERASKN